jgi:hypothetical protein
MAKKRSIRKIRSSPKRSKRRSKRISSPKSSPKRRSKRSSHKRSKRRSKMDGAWYDSLFEKDTIEDPYETMNKKFYEAILQGNSNMVKLLIDSGVDIDNIIIYGNIVIPLIIAIKRDNIEIVKLLLSNGANTNIIEDKKTILEIACEIKNPSMIMLLKEYGASGECDLGPVKRIIIKEEKEEEKPKIFKRPSGGEPPENIGTGDNVGKLYKTYFDLLSKGIPRPAVDAKLRAAGINPAILDLDQNVPLPSDFIIDIKLLQPKKAPVLPKAIQLKESANSEFWKETSVIDNKFTKETEKEVEKNYFTKNNKVVKEIIVTKEETKIVPLLNLDVKLRQNAEIAYKKITSTIPLKPEDLNIKNINSYIKELVLGNIRINETNELLLSILYDLIPHTKEGVAENNKINEVLKVSPDILEKINNGFVLAYENFIYNLFKIDDQFDRIQVLQFKKIFPTDIRNVNVKLDLLTDSISIIKNSEELHEILKLLQKIVNIARHKGGFSLTLINSIFDYKSQSNPKNTILQYVVSFLKSINFDFNKFFNDMQILNQTSTFAVSDMIKTLTTFKNLNKVAERIDSKDKRYEQYLVRKKDIENTEMRIEELNNKFTGLLNFYGEPEDKVDLRLYIIEINNAIKKLKNAV